MDYMDLILIFLAFCIGLNMGIMLWEIKNHQIKFKHMRNAMRDEDEWAK